MSQLAGPDVTGNHVAAFILLLGCIWCCSSMLHITKVLLKIEGFGDIYMYVYIYVYFNAVKCTRSKFVRLYFITLFTTKFIAAN